MKRHLLSLFAVAAVASFAGAQQPAHDSSMKKMHADSAHHAMAGKHHKGMKSDSTKKAHTATSGGEVDRGGPGYSAHAMARDWVRADDTKCDDLCQREKKMDTRFGKDRERKP